MPPKKLIGRRSPSREFCRRNHISEPTYYKLRARGLGPKEMRLGSAVRITRTSELDWQEARSNPVGARGRGGRARPRNASSPRARCRRRNFHQGVGILSEGRRVLTREHVGQFDHPVDRWQPEFLEIRDGKSRRHRQVRLDGSADFVEVTFRELDSYRKFCRVVWQRLGIFYERRSMPETEWTRIVNEALEPLREAKARRRAETLRRIRASRALRREPLQNG